MYLSDVLLSVRRDLDVIYCSKCNIIYFVNVSMYIILYVFLFPNKFYSTKLLIPYFSDVLIRIIYINWRRILTLTIYFFIKVTFYFKTL